ncbi:malectin domain-containing carbohydrate-binding protein [Aeoliella sp. SH292]|uniref:malectin domain-containing carbohydrate-binding protein n=1 Tax=Aeoliella sp. SH292 TaxID=3454464 RepID=UPI003F994163
MKKRHHFNNRKHVRSAKPQLRSRQLKLESLEDRRLLAVLGDTIYRVNAGGGETADTPAWLADTASAISPFVSSGNTSTFTSANSISLSHPSVPAGTPMSIFQTERFDQSGGTNMQWDFPVDPGNYQVRLYFSENWSGAFAAGVRQFDVSIEGTLVLDNYDVFADVGGNTGVVKSFDVTSDGVLDIDFGRAIQNPSIKAIEIIELVTDGNSPLGVSGATADFGSVAIGQTVQQTITLINNGASGDASITIDPSQANITPGGSPFAFQFTSATPIVLVPGASTTVTITYSPTSESLATAALTIPHTGSNAAVAIALSGVGYDSEAVGDIVYRINAGGEQLVGTPPWSVDTAASPSPLSNLSAGGNSSIFSNAGAITLDPSVPAGTPTALFQNQRFDQPAGLNLEWDLPVGIGTYEVRLYFAEIWSGAFAEGVRVFDISIEGNIVEADYDIFADVGAMTGVMKSYTINSDSNLDIDFLRQVQSPMLAGIEIISVPSGELLPSSTSVNFGAVVVNGTSVRQVTLTNDHPVGGGSIVIDPSQTSVTTGAGFAFAYAQSTPIVLQPGQSTTVTVTYNPNAEAANTGTLTIPHSGVNTPISISLAGEGVDEVPISFSKSTLAGVSGLARPTSMQFGPDGRLYISQQNGQIRVYDIVKNGPNDYSVSQSETIDLVQTILNHDDDGTPRPDITTRLVTGILVVGTAENPVIYVGSSDPRIGGGNDGTDTNLDTNSSVLSRITWNGTAWEKLDLVRGLPRSDEQHAINGMVLDPNDPTILYVTVGGNTNMGAPSNNFAFLPEYAYSAAILKVDLATIGNTTYDLPTLDDEDQPGADTSDPFGGNNGKNQAILVPGGPVELWAVGLRNPYDVVFDPYGRMYTIDNGPNGGWGGIPINEGPAGNATNGINEGSSATYGDGLHWVRNQGYYAGHPNPTRANMNNTFNVSNPQSPTYFNNPIEGDYQTPGVDNLAMVVYPASTNGLAVYQGTNFGGQMYGDLITASFDNTIKRIKLNSAGDAIISSEDLFSNVGFRPLDVIAPTNEGFLGTIWAVDVALNTVYIFEPADGATGTEEDRDGDGYLNEDEVANNTNPDNPADVPTDFDGDFVSNLLDPDDDNDTLSDIVDKFAVDPANGATTPIGTFYTWENEGEDLGGLLGMGFTGLMYNGTSNYAQLYDPLAVTAGGAAGVFTVDKAGVGTARGNINTQFQGYQFGFNPVGATNPFAGTTRVLAAFGGHTPKAGQQMGLFLGTGDQDNYVQIVLSGDNGGSIQVLSEFAGVDTVVATTPLVLPGPGAVDFWLQVDPLTLTLQASYAIDGGLRTLLGGPIAIPASWLANAMAVGILSVDPQQESLPVTWDHLGVVSEVVSTGAAAAKVEVYSQGGINNSSTARIDSFRIHNNSTGNKKISSVKFDLSTTSMPDMLFDPNGTAGDTRGINFIPDTGQAATGQTTFNFLAPRDGGFAELEINFSDFNAAELFTFHTDVDPTTAKGSVPPGPSNAADISGLELSGATVNIVFDDGTLLTGQLFALPEGMSFYQSHSEVVLTETPSAAAPSISVLGINTPSIVTSATQTIRVTGPAGAAVRLLQTEVALHLAGVPNGGFDIDPFEGNKVVLVSDATAIIGATGFVDIQVTLTDSLTEGGLTYFSAVIDGPDDRTSAVSNVIKVALNNLPPGSATPGNVAPNVSAGTDQTVSLPNVANLSGTVSDDNLPTGTITTTWSVVSGPGNVTFGNASLLATTASFSATGTYVLQLSANDGELTSVSTVSITVTPQNVAPTVNGGPNVTGSFPGTVNLSGTASDDNLPSGTLTTTWSMVSGPGVVTFGDASQLATTASFSQPGNYVLRLTASDGELSSSDLVGVSIAAPVGPAVTSLTLINANTDLPIPGYTSILPGSTINLALLPTTAINVRANVSGSVGSVRFGYDGNTNLITESTAPYAMFGDSNGNFYVGSLSVGSHTITATPFSGANATGSAGLALSVSFTVINQAANQAPQLYPGPNLNVLVTDTAHLDGWANDDGLPSGTLTSTWSKVSGPGTVTFGNTARPATTANFSAPGTYVLQLSATDGVLTTASTVTINVSAVPVGPAVTSLTLINANTDLPIPGYENLTSGMQINLASLPTTNLNIRANTSGTIGSIKFGLDGNSNFRNEAGAPYALFGDSNGNYHGVQIPVGSHTVTATPYSSSTGTGTAGQGISISFTIIGSAPLAAFAALADGQSPLDGASTSGPAILAGSDPLAFYQLWKSTYGSTTQLTADANNNGRVDLADYTMWRDNIGSLGFSLIVPAYEEFVAEPLPTLEEPASIAGPVVEAPSTMGSSAEASSESEEPLAFYLNESPAAAGESSSSTSSAATATASNDAALLLLTGQESEDDEEASSDSSLVGEEAEVDEAIPSLDLAFGQW